MENVSIKLFFKKDGIEEITTFNWNAGIIKPLSIEEKNELSGETFFAKEDCHNYINEEDIKMITLYINICARNLINIANETNSIICFRKELWMESEPAIVESWLEKNDCSMLRKSTRTEFFNNIINNLSI